MSGYTPKPSILRDLLQASEEQLNSNDKTSCDRVNQCWQRKRINAAEPNNDGASHFISITQCRFEEYKMAILFILLLIFKGHSCDDGIKKFFEEINKDTNKFNSLGADIAWETSLNSDNEELPIKTANYQLKRITWQQKACEKVVSLHDHRLLNETQERQAFLLCRGPKYTYHEARKISYLYEELQSIYTMAEVCIPGAGNITNVSSAEDAIIQYLFTVKHSIKNESNTIFAVKAIEKRNRGDEMLCIKGEDEFERLMKFSRNPQVLRFVWEAWREKMRFMREPFRKLVDIENKASRRNGYSDIGASWKSEIEIKNLHLVCRRLYQSIQDLYALLHGVVRFFLRQQYGDEVSERGPIPAHLLGNLWSQNWEPLIDLILPKQIDLDERIKRLNWTVIDMVKRAEDYYMSLGLPAMSETFWRESVLKRASDVQRCHGTAADMIRDGDFRLLYCSGTSYEDFYVIHHEMGHIQYYMAYSHQPGLFRQANTALHESIGDAIMYGVATPQHLHRLRLINDTELYNVKDINDLDDKSNKINNSRPESKPLTTKNTVQLNDKLIFRNNVNVKIGNSDSSRGITTDDILILRQALNKLPQLPFSLLIDEYRWKYFEGSMDSNTLNSQFWLMARDLQGIAPTVERGEEYFDIGAKFHVPDNTPYIRYFLGGFLQHQVFESLCRVSVAGRRRALPPRWALHRCDLYGSKMAGKTLKNLMSRGTSQHWRQILRETIGENDISANSLKRFYRPLYKLLMRLVEEHSIPIGW